MFKDEIVADYIGISYESSSNIEQQNQLIQRLSEQKICDKLREGLQERYQKEKSEHLKMKTRVRPVWNMQQACTSLKDHLLFLLFGLSYSIFLMITKGKLYA